MSPSYSHTARPSAPTMGAAVLMAATVVLHVVGGGPEVHDPLLAATVDPKLNAFVSVLWHAVTVVLVALAAGLAVLACRCDTALEAVLSGLQLGFAALFIGYGLMRLGNLTDMPQWVIFLSIPVLTRVGQMRRRGRAATAGTA
ncbi:hypothetical protein [Pannonibacter sp.]|uniref:hypothetical protein n=1 Tax=Pannonibacter sp. TaxID=1906786 RepID=UPI003F7279A7